MKKIVSLLIPLLPILSIYKSPIPKVDLSTFIICIIFALIIIKTKNDKSKLIIKKSPLNLLLLYCFYIIASFSICLMKTSLSSELLTVIFRIGKMVLFTIFIVVCINHKIFDYKYSFSIYKKIILASCFMIIFQTIAFYFFKKNIYGVLMPLILQGDYHYIEYDMIKLQYLYRPCAFFLEPSNMTSYFSFFLAILLSKKPNRNDILLSVFVTISMLLTTSGQAYLYGGLLWGIFLFSLMRKKITKKTILVLLIVFLLLPIAINKLYNTEIVFKSLQRIVDGSASGGNAVIGRISTLSYYQNLPIINKVFGVGYGNPVPNVYLSSLTYTLYCTGVIGSIIVLLFFISLLKNYKKRNAVLYWMVSLIFSSTFIATDIGFYLPFLAYNDEVNKE